MFFLYGKPWIGENKRRLMHLLTLFSSIIPIYFFTKLRDLNSWNWQPIKFQNYGFSHLDRSYLDLAYMYIENYKYILIIFFLFVFLFFLKIL